MTLRTFFVALLALFALGLLSAKLDAAEFFVAPGGSDAGPGTLQKPFGTLDRARDAVRGARQQGGAGPFTVYLRAGRYPLNKPLELAPEDSGNQGQPVAYCSYHGEKAIVSGGLVVGSWRKYDERLWVADVPQFKDRKEPLAQLFVNGARRTRARTPNVGSYFYSRRLQLNEKKQPECLGLDYYPGDLGLWANREDARIVLFHNWVNSYNCIGDFDAAKGRIGFARPAGIFFLSPHVRYYVENVFEALDAPGEWYLDRARGRLFYYPMAGEDMGHAEVIAPLLVATLVTVRGDPAAGRFVDNLVFRGISFQHADANLAADYLHSVQGAHTQKGAIYAVGLRSSVIEDCEFTRLGEHAVSLREGCQQNVVRRCHIFDVGGGGIYLSADWPRNRSGVMLTAHNVVENNFIHDNGHIFRAGCGVFLGGSASFNEITHNEICNQSWVGIHAGWSWTGKASTYTHHNTVAYNHIHHLGNGVLNDLGGIYTLGNSPGTVLHHNLIHDITRFERGREGYGGWGIYLDAGSSQIRVENNLVYNTRDGGLHLNCDGGPYDDVVVNNIFACSKGAQCIRDNLGEPDGIHVRLERNIVSNENPKMFGGGNWKPEGKFSSDRNCFWNASAVPPDFSGKPLSVWQAAGRDRDSIVADPGFVDPGRGDFRFRGDSPVKMIGFQTFDVSGAGLFGDPKWTQLPRSVPPCEVEKGAPREPVAMAIADDFEDYRPGARPADARVIEENDEAVIRVSNDCAAAGKQSLKFVDGPGQRHPWDPHLFYSPHFEGGVIQGSFDLRLEPGAIVEHQWRDMGDDGTYFVGPALSIAADGTVRAGGRKVAVAAQGEWVHFEITAGTGPQADGRWQLAIRGAGQAPQRFDDLRCDPQFKRLTWYGFSSLATTRTVFYIDNLTLKPTGGAAGVRAEPAGNAGRKF